MNLIYDVILKRGLETSPDVIIFYDEDREKAIKEMKKYVDKNGFTIYVKDKRFTISDVVLRERESSGIVISVTPYCEIFDTVNGKRI